MINVEHIFLWRWHKHYCLLQFYFFYEYSFLTLAAAGTLFDMQPEIVYMVVCKQDMQSMYAFQGKDICLYNMCTSVDGVGSLCSYMVHVSMDLRMWLHMDVLYAEYK